MSERPICDRCLNIGFIYIPATLAYPHEVAPCPICKQENEENGEKEVA